MMSRWTPALAALGGNGGARPSPIAHAAIAPPFDPDDPNGLVHTVLPPEQVIPPHFTDPAWLRCDFNGVTLDMSQHPGVTIPFLVGANSTPLEMLMTPMLIMYPRNVQDACLTEHAQRGYDDFVIASEGWNFAENGHSYSASDIRAWADYVRSWGFRIVYWRGFWRNEVDAYFQALESVMSFYIHGKEVDWIRPDGGGGTSEEYEASLQRMDAHIQGRIPIGVHFTAVGDKSDGHYGMGYPLSAPRDTFLNDWSPYDGRVHLCQQLGVDVSAGKQGAAMWYARLHINCAVGDAARGPGAPNSRVIAFETMATAQLYAMPVDARFTPPRPCGEDYGNLRDWELLCGTRDNPCMSARPVSGFGNGARYPDGSPI